MRALTIAILALALCAGDCSLAATDTAHSAGATNGNGAPAALKLLKVEPVKGHSGDSFTISADGLPANQQIEFFWNTVDGSYVTRVLPDNLEYDERHYDEKRIALGSAPTDAHGRVTARFVAPEDFGEVHDIYAAADGKNVARGGFRILRSATMTPAEGPVGTPITLTVKGMSWRGFEQFMALRYDNKYTGELSAVTTCGIAVFQIRAAGAPGKHVIQLNNSTAFAPGAYLNTQQSPQAYIYEHLDNRQEFRFIFNVTNDKEPLPDRIEWPDSRSVAQLAAESPRTTRSVDSPLGAVKLHPSAGAVNSRAVLSATGLPPNTEVGLHFVTARGNRMTPSGWNLDSVRLATATTGPDGSLKAAITIPDDLGGWHVVKLATHDRVLLEAPYYVEQSLVQVSPRRLKVGEAYTIQLKGVGWTELDNTVAVTYDNAAIGYACGFNSNGDVTINLVASGSLGTHLIDIYPAIYRGKDRVPWNYQTPFLTYARDFPALARGYRLPAYRLAIEVVE